MNDDTARSRLPRVDVVAWDKGDKVLVEVTVHSSMDEQHLAELARLTRTSMQLLLKLAVVTG